MAEPSQFTTFQVRRAGGPTLAVPSVALLGFAKQVKITWDLVMTFLFLFALAEVVVADHALAPDFFSLIDVALAFYRVQDADSPAARWCWTALETCCRLAPPTPVLTRSKPHRHGWIGKWLRFSDCFRTRLCHSFHWGDTVIVGRLDPFYEDLIANAGRAGRAVPLARMDADELHLTRNFQKYCKVKNDGKGGLGVRATGDIPSGTFVMMYHGRRAPKSASGLNTLEVRELNDGGDPSNRPAFMEGTGLGRLLNGACQPEHANCRGDAVTLIHGHSFADTTVMAITTTKAIRKGEELVWEYGKDMLAYIETIGCTCTHASCKFPRSKMAARRGRKRGQDRDHDDFAQTAADSMEASRHAASALPHLEAPTIAPPLPPTPTLLTPTQPPPTLAQPPKAKPKGRPAGALGLKNKFPQWVGETKIDYRNRCRREKAKADRIEKHEAEVKERHAFIVGGGVHTPACRGFLDNDK